MTTTEENARVRGAYLEIIDNALQKANLQSVEFEPKAYDREQDKVQFSFDGVRCVLLEVEKPNLEEGTIMLTVEKKNTKEVVGISARAIWLQVKTLARIAYEVYDWARGEDWENFEVVEKDTIANFLDSWN